MVTVIPTSKKYFVTFAMQGRCKFVSFSSIYVELTCAKLGPHPYTSIAQVDAFTVKSVSHKIAICHIPGKGCRINKLVQFYFLGIHHMLSCKKTRQNFVLERD